MILSYCAIIKTHSKIGVIKMIETYMLEHILAFQQEGTLSKAAEKLSISQPALTRSMQKFEKEIGIQLFDRYKNRINLNENGKIAAEYAINILNQMNTMIEHIKTLERKKHTIFVGSCAPVPILKVVPALSRIYTEMTISYELNNDKALSEGLENDIYNIIITHEKPNDKDLYYKKCGAESLLVSLPKKHSLAKRKKLHLKDLDGLTMLLYSKIGFWYDLTIREMPNSKFLLQNNREILNELINSSAFPFFTTDAVMNTHKKFKDHSIIPIIDKEANVTYYAVTKSKNKERFKDLFMALK